MIEFIVVGLPRSGTTWVSNWLTTDTTLCLHDATASYTLPQLNDIESSKTLGIADTGLALHPTWVNSHPARKVVIIRDHEAINRSLEACNLPLLDPILAARLLEISAYHIKFEDLFNPIHAAPIYEYLVQKPFDEERHHYLSQMNVQMAADAIETDMTVLRDFIERISKEH